MSANETGRPVEATRGRFGGKVGVVVGAAPGSIGAAAALRLAAEGMSVLAADIDSAGAERTVDEIQLSGGNAVAMRLDLADDDSVRGVIDEACFRYGGLDYLVNSAMTRERRDEDLDVVSTPIEVWRRVLEVNLLGYVRTAREAIPQMIERGGGAIVNLTTGSERASSQRLVAYMSSKSAITALTRNTAIAFGPHGIRANAVCPGPTVTSNMLAANTDAFVSSAVQRSPQRRLGEPQDIAGTIAYLLSDDAAMIAGEVIYVDGGLGINRG